MHQFLYMKPDRSQGIPICDVFVHGSGECDQLGLGEGVLERKKPTCIKSLMGEKVISVAVGSLHNLALTADGRVFSWGCNDDGALGRVGEENVPLPIPTFDKVPIKKICVGDCHSAFLDFANRLWICGSYKDSSGHIGFPDFVKGIGHIHHKQIAPVCVQGLPSRSSIEDVVCGANHTLVLLSPPESLSARTSRSSAGHPSTSYRLVSFGNDEFGQLGLGVRQDDESGRTEEDTVMLKQTSRSRRYQKTKLFPRDVVWNSKTGGGIKKIFATAQGSFIQTRDDSVYGCGLNNFGQLGFGFTSVYPVRGFTQVEPLSGNHVEYISGGTVHTAARTKDGHVFAWGRRDYSGMPSSAHTGMGDVQPPSKLPSLSGITYISCGSSHSIAADNKGRVFTWGFGGTHQLGNLPRDISMGAAGADEEPEDEQEPYHVASKQLQSRFVVAVGAGAQHSVELGWPIEDGEYAPNKETELAETAAKTPVGKRRSSLYSKDKKRVKVSEGTKNAPVVENQ